MYHIIKHTKTNLFILDDSPNGNSSTGKQHEHNQAARVYRLLWR